MGKLKYNLSEETFDVPFPRGTLFKVVSGDCEGDYGWACRPSHDSGNLDWSNTESQGRHEIPKPQLWLFLINKQDGYFVNIDDLEQLPPVPGVIQAEDAVMEKEYYVACHLSYHSFTHDKKYKLQSVSDDPDEEDTAFTIEEDDDGDEQEVHIIMDRPFNLDEFISGNSSNESYSFMTINLSSEDEEDNTRLLIKPQKPLI